MWTLVGGWVKTLIVMVLLGNLVDIVLPKGDLRRYAGLLVGLILLLIMIRPLIGVWRWANGSRGMNALSWMTSGPSLAATIAGEEIRQAEAMVQTVPGVQRCNIQALGANRYLVDVGAETATSGKLIRTVANEAVSVTLGADARIVGIHISAVAGVRAEER